MSYNNEIWNYNLNRIESNVKKINISWNLMNVLKIKSQQKNDSVFGNFSRIFTNIFMKWILKFEEV